jgi:hypothetical protein
MRNLPLELIECADRRLVKGCVDLAAEAAQDGETEVTILLPRRAYGSFWGRLLHDRTSERISAAVSGLDHVSATIVPFDVDRELKHHGAGTGTRSASAGDHGSGINGPAPNGSAPLRPGPDGLRVVTAEEGLAPDGVAVGTLPVRQKAKVAGRVRSVTVKPWGDVPTLEVQLGNGQGNLTVTFLGRRQIAGLAPGSHIAVEGTVALQRGRLIMTNPEYEFVEPNPE